jgi:hypothetical protein
MAINESDAIAQKIAQYGIAAASNAVAADDIARTQSGREQLHWHERLQGAQGSRMARGWLTSTNANYSINGFAVRNEQKFRSNPVGYVSYLSLCNDKRCCTIAVALTKPPMCMHTL